MATTEERMKILNMIKEGKISAEEGAKLLSALGDTGQTARVPPARGAGEPRWFRVRVTDLVNGKTKVSVNIPIGLMEWGMQIGAHFAPEVENLDFEQIKGMLQSGVEGKVVDVIDEEDGEHVEIFIE
ncbi:MAG: SHOCT-like domain-containing protein [Anaerolineales bacterium]